MSFVDAGQSGQAELTFFPSEFGAEEEEQPETGPAPLYKPMEVDSMYDNEDFIAGKVNVWTGSYENEPPLLEGEW